MTTMKQRHEAALNIPWWKPWARQRAIRDLVTESMTKDVALREALEALGAARKRLRDIGPYLEEELLIHRGREEEFRILRRLTSKHPNTYLDDVGGELGTSRLYCEAATNALWSICQNVVSEAKHGHTDKSEQATVTRQLFAIRNLLVAFSSALFLLEMLHDTLTEDEDLTAACKDLGTDVGATLWERTEMSDFREALNDGTVIPFRRP